MKTIRLNDFKPLSEYEWELPRSFRADMRVPVRVFASSRLLEGALRDKSLEQAVNTSTLPGILGWVSVMPDVHQGYGFPIGGVAATDVETGVVSPGGIGYDINCGVRLMASLLPAEAAKDDLSGLVNLIDRLCPSGLGEKGRIRLRDAELDDVCLHGSRWALKNGYADAADVEHTEDQGCLEDADLRAAGARARERGLSQLGTLGSGNHFIEIQIVDEIFDEASAESMGLRKGCLAVQVHSGSRGFGHQICTDYVRSLQSAANKYRILLPDRELACAPISSEEGQAYLKAMRCAANYAYANRQVLAQGVRDAFEQVLAGKGGGRRLRTVYDVAHNIGKIETHEVQGKERAACVHRKGATRSFGPGTKGLPADYRKIGQPVLIPGSMGTRSWVLRGAATSMNKSFGSCAHGAGRLLSRAQAKKQDWGEDLIRELAGRGIHVKAGSLSGLAEEAPEAYKDVEAVIECVAGAGLAEKVAVLRPLAVIKG